MRAVYQYVRGRPVAIGVQVSEAMTFEAWRALLSKVVALEAAAKWALADVLAAAPAERRYQQAIRATGLARSTVANMIWTARVFDHDRRRPELPFSHHQLAAGVSDRAEQDGWLDRAVREGWTTKRLERELRRARCGEPDAGRVLEQPRRLAAPARRIELEVEPERLVRWRAAAAARGLALEGWLVEVADQAATSEALPASRSLVAVG